MNKTNELKLYWIDMKYIRDLQQVDGRVYSVSPQMGKQSRPYLGIIVTCNEQMYCIPLTKAKEKHNNMSDRIDFSKIVINGKLVAGINFSRMIPVQIKQLSKVDMKIRKHDNNETIARKLLYQQELDWCNKHRDMIVNKAKVIYMKFQSGEPFKRRKDCLDFINLENVCKKFNES